MTEGEMYALGEMTYTELEALLASSDRAIAVIPAGSTEAHGPHLPLATDSIISTEMARRGAEALAAAGWDVVVFPTLHYAVTDWAGAFKGSSTLSAATAEGMVLETCLAAHRMGFARVVLTNAHLEPDNISTLRGVAKKFEAAAGQPLLFPDVTRRRNAERLTEEFRSGSCHAGQYETSLVLAVRPELVRAATAAALPEVFVPMHEKIKEGARDFLECGMDQAYCGTPAGGTPEEGEATYNVLAALVLESVRESFVVTAPGEDAST